MEPFATGTVADAVGASAVGDGIIETRTLVAYTLLLLLVAGVIAGIALIRYNSRDRRLQRRRAREREHQKALRDGQPLDP